MPRLARGPAGHAAWLVPLLVCAAGCASSESPDGRHASTDAGGEADTDGGVQGAFCGDERVDPPDEACDEGARNGQYGHCRRDCRGLGERCGDGLMQLGLELCDDGPDNGTPGHCAADCQGLARWCGDGLTARATELCDDGDFNGTYGHCAEDCQALGPRCGDGELQTAAEQCDDGPDNGRYGRCADDCRGAGPGCGDGELQPEHEACDDGPDNGSSGHCSLDCQGRAPFCGDGVTAADGTEQCDDGADNGSYGHCAADCTRPDFPPAGYPATGVDPAWLDDPPACRDHDWFAKYLEYRRRLRGEGSAAYPGFLSLGTGPGQSLPASDRDPATHCASDWWMTNAGCPIADLPDAQGKYQWGDTTIWLGVYLGVLASERAAFALLGLDTTQTDDDLALALAAFDRLDESAEVPFGVAPARDGFFLRSDVPDDFQFAADGSYRFPRADEGLAGYECVSPAGSCTPPTVEDGYFLSQDQVIGMLEGLSLVDRLVPSGTVVRGVDLRQQARGMVHRMVWFLRSNGWRVTDPNGDHPPDEWGGNAIAFSDMLARSADRICGTDFGVDDYRNVASRTEGGAIWAALEAGWSLTFNYNRTMGLRLAAITGVWDAEKMAERAAGDAKEVYALMHALLQGVPLGQAATLWRLESLLDSAPCGGPCHRTPGCGEGPGWRGESRFMNPADRLGGKHRPVGEFNGLDWMLLHNLYLIYRQGAYSFAPVDEPGVPGRADPECRSFPGLTRLLEQGETVDDGTAYDPASPCAAADLPRRFCGRSLAAWIDAAHRGEAVLHTGSLRWDCRDAGPCLLRREPPTGHAGVDLMLGTPGDDELLGLDGDDCLYGFAGHDELHGGLGQDELHGGLGDDELFGEGRGPMIGGAADRLFGDDGRDRLDGGDGTDEMYGGAGDDELDGEAGDDLLEGEAGNDTVRGGAGDDRIDGGEGDDTLDCGGGDDVVEGGPGADRLSGGAGNDTLRAGDGDDRLFGDAGGDSLDAGAGFDLLCGGGGDDVLWGGWDGDHCRSGENLIGGDEDQVNGCDEGSASADDCEE